MTAPADAEILDGFRERNEGVLGRLLRHLELAPGFSLALAWCPDEWTEHVLMAVLQQSQEGRVEVFRADDCPVDANFPTWLFGMVRPLRLEAGDLAVLRVSRASPEKRSHLRELNEHRNAWKRVAPHAWLLVVPSYERARAQDSTLLLGAEMPDIYSIRSGDFHFSPARLPAPIPGDDRREHVPFGVPDERFQSVIAYLEELTPGDTPAAHALYARAVLDELPGLLPDASADQRREIRRRLLRLRPGTLPPALVARTLGALAHLRWLQGEPGALRITARRSVAAALTCLGGSPHTPAEIEDLIHWAEALSHTRFAADDLGFIQHALRTVIGLQQAQPGASRLHTARLVVSLGRLCSRHRELSAANSAYEEALGVYRDLAAGHPQAYRADVARTLINLGTVLRDLGALAEARAAYEEALAIRRDLAAGQPRVYYECIAVTLNKLGAVLLDLRELGEARSVYEEALTIRRELAARQPQVCHKYVAIALNNLGNVLWDLGELGEARAACEEALGVYRELAARQPQVYRADVARTLNNLGTVLSELGELGEARGSYAEALAVWRELTAGQPQAYCKYVALTLNELGNVLWDLAELGEARAAFGEALAIWRELAAGQPQVYREDVAMTLTNLGNLLRDLGEARAAYEEALGMYRELAARQPQVYREDLEVVERSLQRLQTEAVEDPVTRNAPAWVG